MCIQNRNIRISETHKNRDGKLFTARWTAEGKFALCVASWVPVSGGKFNVEIMGNVNNDQVVGSRKAQSGYLLGNFLFYAQKGLVICATCPLLIFLSWMAIWAGLSTTSANSFIMPEAGEDLFCRRWVIYELYRTSTLLLSSNLGKLALSWGQ